MNHKWLKYCLGVFLAVSFHTSAVFFLLFLPLCFIKEKNYDIILKVFGVAWIFSILVSVNLISYNPLSFLANMGNDYYSSYADIKHTVGTSTSLERALLFDVVSIGIFFYTFNRNKVFSFLVLFSSIVMNFSLVNQNMARFYYYFVVLDYVYISFILSTKTYSRKSERNYVLLGQTLFISYCVFRLINTFVLGTNILDMPVTYSWSNFFN
jgi:hypothetical protein